MVAVILTIILLLIYSSLIVFYTNKVDKLEFEIKEQSKKIDELEKVLLIKK